MITIPGTSSDKRPVEITPPAVAAPEPIDVPSTPPDPAADPAVLSDGTALDDSVQVAGVGSALRGLVGRVMRKGEKIEDAASKAAAGVEDAAKAAGATPPPPAPPVAPPPTPAPAPKPPKKTVQQIKQGVMDRSGTLADPAQAQGVASEMTAGVPRQIEPGRTTSRNFRADKLQTTDDIKALIDDVAESSGGMEDAKRGVQTWEQTGQEAEKYGLDELLGRKVGEAWNAAQLQAGRSILLELGGRIQKAAALVDSGKASAEDMLAFRRLLAQHVAVQETLQGAVAEAGRALNIMRSVTAAGGRVRSKQVLETLEGLGGDDTTRKLAEMLVEGGTDPAKIAKITRQAWKATTKDALYEVWINGLLSGPQTHIANTIGNTMTAGMQIPERFAAGVLGKFHKGERVELSESQAMLYGLLTGWQDGMSALYRTMKTGEPTDAVAKLENANRKAFTSGTFGVNSDSVAGKALDLFGEYYVRMPGRALMAEDEMFKAVAYRMELNAQAARRASQEGLTGEQFTARVQELVQNPPEDLHLSAEAVQRYLTFQDGLSGGGVLNAVGRGMMAARDAELAGLPVGKLVLPFVRTPINIAKFAVERSPVAPLSAQFRDAWAKGGAARDLAVARWGMGSTLAAVVATYASEGVITGNGPTNPEVRKALQASGWQPCSILGADGTYYSLNRLDPVGQMVCATADAVDILKYAKDDETKEATAAAVILGFADVLANKSYLQSVGGVVDALRNPDEGGWKRWAAREAGTVVPAWLSFARNAADETKRKPSSADLVTLTLDTLKNRVPGLSEDVPPDLDVWGRSLVREEWPVSPVKESSGTTDRATKELIANRVPVTVPQSSVGIHLPRVDAAVKVDLATLDETGWVLHDYRKKVGELAHEYVGDAVEGREYAKLGPEDIEARRQIIQGAFTKARADALTWLVDKYPRVQQAAEDAWAKGPQVSRMPIPAHMEGGDE